MIIPVEPWNPPLLDPTIDSLEIGTFLSNALFGIATKQTYWYYGHYPNDRKGLKAMVCLHVYQFSSVEPIIGRLPWYGEIGFELIGSAINLIV